MHSLSKNVIICFVYISFASFPHISSLQSQLRESTNQDDLSQFGLNATSSLPGTVIPTRSEALMMVKEKNAEVVEMKERLASVEQTCSQMAAQMSAMVSMMANMQKASPENLPSAVSL